MTPDAVDAVLLQHRTAMAGWVKPLLHRKTADVYCSGDFSDVFDDEDPKADGDEVTQLIVVERVEGPPREVDAVLGRVTDATCGLCRLRHRYSIGAAGGGEK